VSGEIGSADFGNQPVNFADLMYLLEARLDHGRRWSCKVAGFRKKMGKWIVEFEAKDLHGTGAGEERYIGKIYGSDRGR